MSQKGKTRSVCLWTRRSARCPTTEFDLFSILLSTEQAPDQKFYLAHCLELDVVAQADTFANAIKNLSELVNMDLPMRKSGKYEPSMPAPQEYFDAFVDASVWEEQVVFCAVVKLSDEKGL